MRSVGTLSFRVQKELSIVRLRAFVLDIINDSGNEVVSISYIERELKKRDIIVGSRAVYHALFYFRDIGLLERRNATGFKVDRRKLPNSMSYKFDIRKRIILDAEKGWEQESTRSIGSACRARRRPDAEKGSA